MTNDKLPPPIPLPPGTTYTLILPAELAALRAKVVELIRVGTGEICHQYRGGCPDELNINDRDPTCPACKILGPPASSSQQETPLRRLP